MNRRAKIWKENEREDILVKEVMERERKIETLRKNFSKMIMRNQEFGFWKQKNNILYEFYSLKQEEGGWIVWDILRTKIFTRSSSSNDYFHQWHQEQKKNWVSLNSAKKSIPCLLGTEQIQVWGQLM